MSVLRGLKTRALSLSLAELAMALDADLRGDGDARVERVSVIEKAVPGDVTFLSNPRYRRHLQGTRATAVILSARYVDACPTSALVMDNPYLGYARAAGALNPELSPPQGIHPTAWVSEEATVVDTAWVGPKAVIEAGAVISARAFVGPGCVVGEDARLGEETTLVANVTVCHGVIVGQRVLIHPGAVIGADGFGLAKHDDIWVKIPQIGNVVIGDDVEVGANTTIDRGALADTVIEHGVKLDNQIQIGHNCQIGENTAMAGTVAIAGSTTVGKRCSLGGGVGVNGHIDIADDVHVTGRSVIYRSITEPGLYSSGMPLQESRTWRRNFPRYAQLDEMHKRLKDLADKSKG